MLRGYKQIMDKLEWKKKIKKAMDEHGVDKTGFSMVIDTLSDILAERDNAYEEFKNEGGEACVIKTSDRGAKNVAKNPRLLIWLDLNNTALAYWRDLGLTPAGYRKLNADVVQDKGGEDGLEKILARLTG